MPIATHRTDRSIALRAVRTRRAIICSLTVLLLLWAASTGRDAALS